MTVKKGGQVAAVLNTHTEYAYKDAEEIIKFGTGVMRGTNKETQCKKYAQSGGPFLGVAAAKTVNTGDNLQYKVGDSVEIITRGVVWVEIASAVTAGDKAAVGADGKFAKTGTGSYDDIDGVFENSASSGYAILKLK